MIFYDDTCCQIYRGHALDVLARLPTESVQCCVTSPPFFGLRKYRGKQEEVWDGKAGCGHEWGKELVKIGAHHADETNPDKEGYTKDKNQWPNQQGQFCTKCGAWHGGFGLEPSVELYIAHSIEVLRAIRRVLKPDGTCYWNIGDSYASGKGTCFNPGGGDNSLEGHAHLKDAKAYPLDRGNKSTLKKSGLKPLDLCGIPYKVGLAAQADDWYWRSMIHWIKPNPMPESVNGWRWEKHKVKVGDNSAKLQKRYNTIESHGGATLPGLAHMVPVEWQDCPGCPKCSPNDGLVLRKGAWRPTKCVEYVLLLAKSANNYGDKEAVVEKYTEPLNRWGGDTFDSIYIEKAEEMGLGRVGWASTMRAGREGRPHPEGRNLRNAWTFPTESCAFAGEHFAAFPEELPRRCILAGTSEKGNCPKCGKSWARVVEVSQSARHSTEDRDSQLYGDGAHRGKHAEPAESKTLGWRATCRCGLEPEPATVLDPFCGTGTTLAVAKSLGRRAIGIDISEQYCRLSQQRVKAIPLPMRM